jgi:hypothetical protein
MRPKRTLVKVTLSAKVSREATRLQASSALLEAM